MAYWAQVRLTYYDSTHDAVMGAPVPEPNYHRRQLLNVRGCLYLPVRSV